MTKLRLIIFILLFIPTLIWASAPQCSDLFYTGLTAKNMAKPLVDLIPWESWKVLIQESRVSSADVNGMIEVVRNAIFDIELTDGFHRNSAVYYSKKKSPRITTAVPTATTSRWSKNLFQQVRDKAMTYVIEAYRKRRPHWPANFHEKLLRIAKLYEKESTYILVENRPWNYEQIDPKLRPPLEIVGAIRLIHEKDGFVPMEDYLGIKIKADKTKLKVEPGNFAMAQEGNEIASVEFAIQMIAQMKRYRAEFGKEPFFVTYADAFSERLYGGMGFQYLKGDHFENAPPEAYNEGPFRIHKDDVDWAPMYATEQMLIDHLKSRLVRTAEKRKSDLLLTQLLKALNRTENTVTQPPEVFVGTGSTKYNQHDTGTVARLYIQRKNEQASLYLQPQYEYENRAFRAGLHLTTPVPIPEGWQGRSVDGGLMTYSKGVLRVTETVIAANSTYTMSYQLAIDPMLLQPIWIRAIQMDGSTTLQDSIFQF